MTMVRSTTAKRLAGEVRARARLNNGATLKTKLPVTEWADRFPLGTAIAFTDLTLKCHDNGCGPLGFVFETVVSCLDDAELERFEFALQQIKSVASDEAKRRRKHGVLPRKRVRGSEGGNVVSLRPVGKDVS